MKQRLYPLELTGVRLRLAVCSDLHVCEAYPSEEKLGRFFHTLNELSSRWDAVIFVGDLTDGGTPEQYTLLQTILRRHTSMLCGADHCPTALLFTMGNHDTYGTGPQTAAERFTSYTGQAACQLQTLAHVPLITLSPDSTADDSYTGRWNFLRDALQRSAALCPQSPIFVFAHHGIRGTAYLTQEWYGNYGEGSCQDLAALLRRYPQTIHISGHSHAMLEDDRSIDQSAGFTAVQDSTVGAYFENESGKYALDTALPQTVPMDGTTASEALAIDVLYSGETILRRLNLTAGQWCGQPWHIAPLQSGCPRPYQNRQPGPPPFFAPGAAGNAQRQSDGSILVHFPAAEAATNNSCDQIHEYRLLLTDRTGKVVHLHPVFADCWSPVPQNFWQVRLLEKQWPAGAKLTAQVLAVTSFGAASAPLPILTNF